MQTRLSEFKNVTAGLSVFDVQNAANFPLWLKQWGDYIVGTSLVADRPPVKPPHA